MEETCKGGNGTYPRNGYIYSSLAGYLHTFEDEDGKVDAIVLFCTSTIFYVSIASIIVTMLFIVYKLIIVHVSFFF